MSFRIKVRVFIDENDSDGLRVVRDIVELAEVSKFLSPYPRELEILENLTNGKGISHEQLCMLAGNEFVDTLVCAAEENGMANGDVQEVRTAAFALSVMLSEPMRFDNLVMKLLQDKVFNKEEPEEENES